MPTDTYPTDSQESQDTNGSYNETGTNPQAKFDWYADWFIAEQSELISLANGGDERAGAVLFAAQFFKNSIDQYNEIIGEGSDDD